MLVKGHYTYLYAPVYRRYRNKSILCYAAEGTLYLSPCICLPKIPISIHFTLLKGHYIYLHAPVYQSYIPTHCITLQIQVMHMLTKATEQHATRESDRERERERHIHADRQADRETVTHTHTHTHMCVHAHTHTRTCTNTSVCTHTHACMHTHTHTHECAHTCTRTHTHKSCQAYSIIHLQGREVEEGGSTQRDGVYWGIWRVLSVQSCLKHPNTPLHDIT